MNNNTFAHALSATLACLGMFVLTSCTGIFDDIYDEPQKEVVPAKGQVVVDATSWTDWYYIDLKQLQQLTEAGDDDALLKAQTEHEPWSIPMTLTGESDGHSGQYLYWFDVLGSGIENNEFRSYTPCDAQPEPTEWSFAVHRNNVRTNGGAVFKTQCTSMDNKDQMLLGLVPSQGIKINKVLSSWLNFKFNIPPDYIPDSHVFVLRLNDGTYAALQLVDYLSPAGKKCWLTINYKYPY